MANDVKNILRGARKRTSEFSTTYIKDRPILPVVISFLVLLYVFLRSLFVFLLVALPIFIFIGYAFRLIFHIHQQNMRNAKGDINIYDSSSRIITQSLGGRNLDKRAYSYAHAQSVRRRNSRKNEMHVHFQDEKKFVSSTVNDNILVDKAALVEETPKEIREVEIEPMANNRFNGKKVIFDGENSDEDGKKAIKWSQDDQKNLIDLGFSENERNKRLESLMAKRKARKLLTLQVRRTLMNIRKDAPSHEMASILIPKMGNKSSEPLVSPTPGSAPSVLLPVHNPFDIPYDPQEEKPNLTGGFQEDLVENSHNEGIFCRHESFSLGTISPGPWELYSPSETSHHLEYAIRPMAREIPEFSRFRKQSDKKDLSELTEIKTSQESEIKGCTNSSEASTQQSESLEKSLDLKDGHKGDATKEIDNEPKLDIHGIQESSSSSSSEINAPFSIANKDEILRSLSFSLRKNVPVTELDTNIRTYYEHSSTFEEKQGNDQKGMCNIHTRSHSIASDLQVELSEVGSQITNLSSGGESPKYDIEGNFGHEVWVSSSQLKNVEENEARSREVREVSEQDIIEVGFSRINHDVEEPVAFEDSQNQSGGFVDKVHEETLPNNKLGYHENNVENLEEPSNSAENSAMDEMIVYEIIDQKDLVNDEQGIIDLIEDTYGEDLDCMDQGTSQNLSASNLIVDAKSIDLTEENSTQPENNSQVREVLAENGPSEASSSTSTVEDKDPLIPLEKTTDRTELINIADRPEINNLSNEGQDEFNPSLVRPIEPVLFLGVDPTPIAVIPELAVEQVVADSSPSSSPNSVLQHKFSVDNLASNASFDNIQMAYQHSNVEMEQNDNVLEDSVANHTRAGDSAGFQDSSFPLIHSIEDNSNYATRDVLVQESDDGADIGKSKE